MSADTMNPIPIQHAHTPLYKRFASIVEEGGQLREVAPRRFVCSKGATHFLSAVAIRKAVDAGLLRRERVRSYRFGEQLSA